MLTNLFVTNLFTKPTVVFRDENDVYTFTEAILKEFEYCKKAMEKYFNKNLIMSEKEEKHFNQVTFAGFVKNSLMLTMKK